MRYYCFLYLKFLHFVKRNYMQKYNLAVLFFHYAYPHHAAALAALICIEESGVGGVISCPLGNIFKMKYKPAL